MREQILKMKLEQLTNMGNWETGKLVRYVQCAVYTVCTCYKIKYYYELSLYLQSNIVTRCKVKKKKIVVINFQKFIENMYHYN